MDYEKKYKEALEKARKELQTCSSIDCDAARQIFRLFPELKKSEDEKIRKEIISIIHYAYGTSNRDKYNKLIAWLEKQDTMAEAGYTFDFEKKELKKIEQKPVSITDEWIEDYWQHHKVINPYSYDKGEEIQFDHQGFVRFCKKYCRKLTWSEEDEERFQSCIKILQSSDGYDTINTKWLKSLKKQLQK